MVTAKKLSDLTSFTPTGADEVYVRDVSEAAPTTQSKRSTIANLGVAGPTGPTGPTGSSVATLIRTGVRNATGSTLVKGTPVYGSGFHVGSNEIEVTTADAVGVSTMPSLGLIEADIANNANGFIVEYGVLAGFDTTMFIDNDPIYIASGGGLTATRPTGTAIVQKTGHVMRVHATLGEILVLASGAVHDLPNLPLDTVWLGSAAALPVSTALSAINLSQFNDDLGLATLPVVDTTEIIKGSTTTGKRMRFEVDGFAVTGTRVITVADQNIDMTPGVDYQVQDAVLDDLAALTPVADNEFIVGIGAGVYAHEGSATVRISLGLGGLAVLGSVGTAEIDNGAVTYAKIQNTVTSARVIGRNIAGPGSVEEINEATFKAMFNLEIGTDVLAETPIGIADTNLLVARNTAVSTEYARFTANGLESRSEVEFKADFNLQAGVDFHVFDTTLEDLAALDTVLLGEFIVGTGAGAYTHQKISAQTAETAPTAGDVLLGEEAGGGIRKFDVGDIVRGVKAVETVTGTAYTFVLGDRGKLKRTTNAAAVALTIPANASVAYAVGDSVHALQDAAGQITFAGATGVTVKSTAVTNPTTPRVRKQNAIAVAVKLAVNTWVVGGELIVT